MNQVETKPSHEEIEAQIQWIKFEEQVERFASLIIPFIRAGLVTGTVLYIFNLFLT
jgi:hypothetical protein